MSAIRPPMAAGPMARMGRPLSVSESSATSWAEAEKARATMEKAMQKIRTRLNMFPRSEMQRILYRGIRFSDAVFCSSERPLGVWVRTRSSLRDLNHVLDLRSEEHTSELQSLRHL